MTHPHTGYDPRAIANLIIEYGEKLNLPLSNLSIQKLLYFSHASHLALEGRPLINGAFEAWEYGPVCRTVYNNLKHYGRKVIRNRIEKMDPFTYVKSPIEPPQDELIRNHVLNIVRNLGNLSPGKLVELSHAKGGAWHTVWEQSKKGATIGNRISDKLSQEKYFALKFCPSSPAKFGEIDEAKPFTGN